MDRTLPRRLLALLIASVFLSGWAGDVFGYHRCPHHSWIAGAGESRMEAPATEHAGHHAHGHGAAPVAASASADDHHASSPAGHPADHETCTCSGGCPSVTGALPSYASADLRAAFTPGETLLASAPERPARRFDPFFLPYAQAPPVG
ncbi:MAG TPA: hypothetical protein VFQ39_04560 [Longimicrobium sp.]|nr:hypothetical protein [Longimicrobium sp.]